MLTTALIRDMYTAKTVKNQPVSFAKFKTCPLKKINQ